VAAICASLSGSNWGAYEIVPGGLPRSNTTPLVEKDQFAAYQPLARIQRSAGQPSILKSDAVLCLHIEDDMLVDIIRVPFTRLHRPHNCLNRAGHFFGEDSLEVTSNLRVTRGAGGYGRREPHQS
jgi:hypothetical protein